MAWNGTLTVEDYTALWRGAIGNSRPHRHFAAQAILSNHPVIVTCGGRSVEGNCVLIEPNTEHWHSSSPRAEVYFLEPITRGDIAPDLFRRLRSASPVLVSDDRATPFWTAWLTQIALKTLDARIARRVDVFDEMIASGPVRLSDLAQASGLSPGRFRHLFAAEMGIPFKRYVLWRRMRMAAHILAAGASVSDAAHGGGFADSAHFARTLKAMFGIHATELFHRGASR